MTRLSVSFPEAGRFWSSAACLAAIFLLLIPGCAGIGRVLFEAPFDPQTTAALVGNLKEQNDLVQSFFSSGRLWVKSRDGEEQEASIFSAAAKDSSRIKIEVTHPWGQPVLHILVDGTRLRLLSFSERKLYLGELTGEALSGFFSEVMDPGMIWDLLRGYPVLEPPYRASSQSPNRIGFAREGGEEKVIRFDRESLRPAELILPRQNFKMLFSDFQVSGGISYARETALVHVLGGKRLIHEIEEMVFNRAIPDQVFTLEAPPGFETAPLKKE